MCTEKKNYNSIDIMKFIMAIFVVSIHTEPLTGVKSPVLYTLWDCVVRCAVPFFFIASGFFIGKKMCGDKKSDIGIVLKQVKRIAKMYLVWSAVYMPLAVYDFWRCGYSLKLAVDTYLRYFLLLGENYNSWMLWYLLSTVYALLFTALLLKFKIKPLYIAVFGFLLFVAGLVITEIVYYPNDLPHILSVLKTYVVKTFINGRIFTGFFYIPLGIVLAKKQMPLWLGIVLFTAGFTGNYFFDGVAGNILVSVCATGVFFAVCNMNLKDRPIYRFLRNASTDIYLVHMYVWTFYYFIVYRQKTFGVDSFIVTTAVSLLVSVAFSFVKKFMRRKSA